MSLLSTAMRRIIARCQEKGIDGEHVHHNVVTGTELWPLFLAAFNTADDLHDVIEMLRRDGRYAESDRLRTLQRRLYEAAEPFAAEVGRPPRDVVAAMGRTVVTG